MSDNLFAKAWADIESAELRLLLDKIVGGPGQYEGKSPNRIYLPLGGASCRVILEFQKGRIISIQRGPAFRPTEWDRFSEEVQAVLIVGRRRVGREYSFSSFRVDGSWRGSRSGVQILPPPEHAPRAPVEMAEHPFVLEFPILESSLWPITNHRRLQEHRKLTLLLNVLLAGRTSVQPRRSDHFWAHVPQSDGSGSIQWVQQSYFAKLGQSVIDDFSPETDARLDAVAPDAYYEMTGNDGLGLRVPDDLDESILLYQQLSSSNRAKFGRATFWLDMASRQWNISVSLSFAALVAAIESLTERGTAHRVYCPECDALTRHDAPGATERFRTFLEHHAPGVALRSQRSEMYKLRSDILHGSGLMQLDEDFPFGWDPPWWNQHELHFELWRLTRTAMRHWLREAHSKQPSARGLNAT